MPHSRISGEEIVRRGEELYERSIKQIVETEENIGKICSMDIETGEFVVDPDALVAGYAVRAKHADAAIYGKKIGYRTAFSLGGTLTRTGI